MTKFCPHRADCPRLDVIMPVYNAAPYLRQALRSILKQTYTNWRLFACDDASTDSSWKILQEFARKDRRIHLMRNKVNLKGGKVVKILMDKCTAQYIVKMDADDISLPDRFAKQLRFLQQHPQVVAVGGQCLLIDKKGRVFGEKKFLTDPEQVYKAMFTSVPAQFPAVTFNTGLIPKGVAWYQSADDSIVEDVALFFSLTKYGQITNLPDYVLKYRIHGHNVTLVDPKKTFKLTWRQRLNAIKIDHYRPTLGGWAVNLAQLLAVTILPTKIIVPLFYYLKGVKIA